MKNEATLTNDGKFTCFEYDGNRIRFRTSNILEKYTKILEWNYGYLVVMAKYKNMQEEEEYIDLIPILQNLYFDIDEFLEPIQSVRVG